MSAMSMTLAELAEAYDGDISKLSLAPVRRLGNKVTEGLVRAQGNPKLVGPATATLSAMNSASTQGRAIGAKTKQVWDKTTPGQRYAGAAAMGVGVGGGVGYEASKKINKADRRRRETNTALGALSAGTGAWTLARSGPRDLRMAGAYDAAAAGHENVARSLAGNAQTIGRRRGRKMFANATDMHNTALRLANKGAKTRRNARLGMALGAAGVGLGGHQLYREYTPEIHRGASRAKARFTRS